MVFNRNFYMTSALCMALAVPSIAQDTPSADQILATVNGNEITLGHVIALIDELPDEYAEIPAGDLLSGVLDQMIQQVLLSEASEINEKLLTLSMENSERALLASRHLGTIIDTSVTQEALDAAYKEFVETTPPNLEWRASHILVETEDEAKALVTELEGGKDFAELAAEKSTGPSGPSGGDLGWFGKGRMVPEFEAAVSTLEAGQISVPVQTQFGWHVLKLFETRNHPPLEEISEEFANNIRQKAIESEITSLESKATVERAELNFDPSVVRDTTLLD